MAPLPLYDAIKMGLGDQGLSLEISRLAAEIYTGTHPILPRPIFHDPKLHEDLGSRCKGPTRRQLSKLKSAGLIKYDRSKRRWVMTKRFMKALFHVDKIKPPVTSPGYFSFLPEPRNQVLENLQNSIEKQAEKKREIILKWKDHIREFREEICKIESQIQAMEAEVANLEIATRVNQMFINS